MKQMSMSMAERASAMEGYEKLSMRHRDFADEYIRNRGNATQAYLKAYGCALSTATRYGYELARKPEIKEYLKLRNEDFSKDNIADLEECLSILTDILRADDSDRAEKMRAADMRLKTLGAYIDKKEVAAKIDSTTVVNLEIEE